MAIKLKLDFILRISNISNGKFINIENKYFNKSEANKILIPKFVV